MLGSLKVMCVSPFLGQKSRSMATLKDIAVRLRSVKNIQKITASMKMVSASKFARAERDLRPARPYGYGARGTFKVYLDCHSILSDRGISAKGDQT